MKHNRFRKTIAEGRMPVGHMVWEFSSRGIARLLEAADVDFAIFDMEHSSIDIERIADLLAWSRGCSFTPIVRVPQTDYHFFARVMDAGAMGVMVPNVQTVDQARQIVDAVKYAPLGHRGVGLATAHTDYVMPDAPAYFQAMNESSIVICQIESEIGVQNADAIGAVPGVDLLWVGHSDLSTAMGIPMQFDHPRFNTALETVIAAAKRNNRRLGIQPGSMDLAKRWVGMGFDVISWSADSSVYRSALTTAVSQVRQSLG